MHVTSVSHQHPHTPPTQYALNAPPYVPNIQLLPEAQQVLVATCAIVANVAAQAMTSEARVFCYNVLSANNWANQDFELVVKMTADRATALSRGNGSTVMGNLQQAAVEILGLFTSVLVIHNPVLQSNIPPQVYNNCNINAQTFDALRQEHEAMYRQTGYNRPNFPAQGSPYGNRQPTATFNQNQGAAPHPAARGMTNTRPTQQQQQQQPARQPQKTVQPQPTAKENTANNAITGEIENMDRNAHSIVYFGHEFKQPTPPLRRGFEEAVETHENLVQTMHIEETPFVSQAWLAETSLEELINGTRARFMGKSNGGIQIFLVNGLVPTPVVSPIDMTPLFQRLAKSVNFADMADALMRYVQSVQDPIEQRHVLTYVSQINKLLTPILNNFLENRIEYDGKLRISDFISDAKDVTSYLNDKFKGQYNKAYTDYQRRVVEHLFAHTRAVPQEGEPDPVTMLTDYSEDGVHWDNITESYTLVYVSATAKELGYNVGESGKRVMNTSSPMLYRLLSTVEKYRATDTFFTTNALVVTSDNVRYQLNIVQPQNGGDTKYVLKEV